MENRKIAEIILFILAFTFVGWSQEKKLIAISNLAPQGVEASQASAFTDRLGTELFKTRSFKVIERSQIAKILEEQEFQQADCVSDKCMIQVGQLLGVSYVLTGGISKIGETYSINIRVIDVKSGEVIYTDTEDCSCVIDKVFVQSTLAIARKISTFFQKEDKQKQQADYSSARQGTLSPSQSTASTSPSDFSAQAGSTDSPKRSLLQNPWFYAGAATLLVGGAVAYYVLTAKTDTVYNDVGGK